MHGNLVHMPIKPLHSLYQARHQKPHLNNCLLLLSTFLPHNRTCTTCREKGSMKCL